jgi:hypothetical protein
MKYLTAGCSIWKLFPVREDACDYISKASNVTYKLSTEISISRPINLKGELHPEINYFP